MNDQRRITIKGVGHVTAKPDLAEISISVATLDKNYAESVRLTAEKTEMLGQKFLSAGFAADTMRSTDFTVEQQYHYVENKPSGRDRVFDGYKCTQRLKARLSLEKGALSRAVEAIASSGTHAEFSVAHTIKDPSAVSRALLESAAKNAREKAETLASAMGVKVGRLVTIDYDWTDISFYSASNYGPKMLAQYDAIEARALADVDPEDIDADDSAVFVWEIAD